MKRALRRAVTSRRLFLLAALLLIVGPVGGTWAYFSASTVSASSQFTGGWVGEASAGSVGVSGYDAVLNWTKATHVDAVTGQTVTYADQNTISNCTGATYSSSVGAVGTGTTFTTSGFTSALNGHYVCFKLVTADNNWSSQGYLFGVAHLGLFPTAYTSANGGTSGQGDAGDTISITFNQNLQASSLPAQAPSFIDVCFLATMIVVGDTSGCVNATDAYTIGQINGIANTRTFDADQSTMTLSGATISITIGTSHNGANSHSGTITGVAASTFTAAAAIKSAALTDQASACTALANGCVPTAGGGSAY